MEKDDLTDLLARILEGRCVSEGNIQRDNG